MTSQRILLPVGITKDPEFDLKLVCVSINFHDSTITMYTSCIYTGIN